MHTQHTHTHTQVLDTWVDRSYPGSILTTSAFTKVGVQYLFLVVCSCVRFCEYVCDYVCECVGVCGCVGAGAI
jgi:hypothetical protein